MHGEGRRGRVGTGAMPAAGVLAISSTELKGLIAMGDATWKPHERPAEKCSFTLPRAHRGGSWLPGSTPPAATWHGVGSQGSFNREVGVFVLLRYIMSWLLFTNLPGILEEYVQESRGIKAFPRSKWLWAPYTAQSHLCLFFSFQ